MYDYLKGVLTKITAKYIVLEAGGLGYIINVANPYSFSDQLKQELKIYLHHVVREDAQLLYGFHTEEEKAVFLQLISVTGIGPTSALAIIAADDNDGLVQAIDKSDVKYLMKFPKRGLPDRSQGRATQTEPAHHVGACPIHHHDKPHIKGYFLLPSHNVS